MDQCDFIAFKSSLERLRIAELIERGPSQLKNSPQRSDIFWIVLERKIRNTFWYKGRRDHHDDERTPALRSLLDLQTPKSPPFLVLRTFIEMSQSIDACKYLVERYPDSVHVQLLNGDMLLHRVIEIGGYQSKDFVYSLIYQSIMSNTTTNYESSKFGGLSTKNNAGLSPLMKLFGLVVFDATRNPYSMKWIWLKGLIQRAVHLQLHHSKIEKIGGKVVVDPSTLFDNDYFSRELLSETPLLHAALELDCPLGLLNRIIDSCRVEDFCRRDCLNRTPLIIALGNTSSPAEIVIELFRKTPARVLQLLNMDAEGDLPLHRMLKAGIKYKSRNGSDVSLIATVVENAPKALFTFDELHDMPPFMLACIDNQWSLDVIFGLLRAGPFAIEPYTSKK